MEKGLTVDMCIFEETLFTNTIIRFPFFWLDRTLIDKYVPADNLQGEQEKQQDRKSGKLICSDLMSEKQFQSKHQWKINVTTTLIRSHLIHIKVCNELSY